MSFERDEFDLFNANMFSLDDDGYVLKPIDDCGGYFCFPEALCALTKGTHFWSVKCVDGTNHHCYRYIGVSAVRCKEYTEFGKSGSSYGWEESWAKKQGHALYVEGGFSNWTDDDVFTVKLDCDENECVWLRNDVVHKKCSIEPNRGYYFVAQFCASKTSYKSVETPAHVFKL